MRRMRSSRPAAPPRGRPRRHRPVGLAMGEPGAADRRPAHCRRMERGEARRPGGRSLAPASKTTRARSTSPCSTPAISPSALATSSSCSSTTKAELRRSSTTTSGTAPSARRRRSSARASSTSVGTRTSLIGSTPAAICSPQLLNDRATFRAAAQPQGVTYEIALPLDGPMPLSAAAGQRFAVWLVLYRDGRPGRLPAELRSEQPGRLPQRRPRLGRLQHRAAGFRLRRPARRTAARLDEREHHRRRPRLGPGTTGAIRRSGLLPGQRHRRRRRRGLCRQLLLHGAAHRLAAAHAARPRGNDRRHGTCASLVDGRRSA